MGSRLACDDPVGAAEAALAMAAERADLGAFWALDGERAMGQAEMLAAGRGTRALTGAPVAIKDLFDVAGLPTTAGLVGRHTAAVRDAQLVRRLRSAGAIPIGKAATDTLGLTTGGHAPGFPACINPLDAALSPGGSSSGPAVAVAAGIVPVGLGSDTAGSARIPAAYCGIVALKPPLRRLRRGGMVPVMGVWDLPAVLARSVADCVAVFGVLGGRSPARPLRRRLRVGLLFDLLEASEPSVAEGCKRAAARLDAGVEVRSVELGIQGRGFGVLLAQEFEQRWGDQVGHDPERFPAIAQEMVASARRRGSEAHIRAAHSLHLERDHARRRVRDLDAVLSPTVPIPAPTRSRESVVESTRFTRLFSALGWPAVSVPAGEVDGAPFAMQVSGLPSRLGEVLAVAELLDALGPVSD